MTESQRELLATIYVAGMKNGYSMSFNEWLEADPDAKGVVASLGFLEDA